MATDPTKPTPQPETAADPAPVPEASEAELSDAQLSEVSAGFAGPASRGLFSMKSDQSSTLKDDETGEPLHVQQRKQIETYREAWKDAGHRREPRVSVSRSIFALVDDRDRAYLGRDARDQDQVGYIDANTRAIFGEPPERRHSAPTGRLLRSPHEKSRRNPIHVAIHVPARFVRRTRLNTRPSRSFSTMSSTGARMNSNRQGTSSSVSMNVHELLWLSSVAVTESPRPTVMSPLAERSST